MMPKILKSLLLLTLINLSIPAAYAIDWSGVQGLDFNLFYPGQRSWEFVLTRGEHSGAPRFRGSKNCNQCHDEDEAKLATNILSNIAPKDTYGDPAQKPKTIRAHVQSAYDAQGLHFRIEWKPTGYVPSGKKLDPDHQTKVTVMIGDQSVRLARRAGCWPMCHDNLRDMPSEKRGSDVTMYLPVSRTDMTREGGGERIKPLPRIDKIRDANLFMEYWQARLNPGSPAVPASGYVLEARHEQQQTQVSADARFENGKWIVELSRPWNASGAGVRRMQPQGIYMLGFAIHEEHAAGRHHYVSLEKMLAFRDRYDAHLVAERQ